MQVCFVRTSMDVGQVVVLEIIHEYISIQPPCFTLSCKSSDLTVNGWMVKEMICRVQITCKNNDQCCFIVNLSIVLRMRMNLRNETGPEADPSGPRDCFFSGYTKKGGRQVSIA